MIEFFFRFSCYRQSYFVEHALYISSHTTHLDVNCICISDTKYLKHVTNLEKQITGDANNGQMLVAGHSGTNVLAAVAVADIPAMVRYYYHRTIRIP